MTRTPWRFLLFEFLCAPAWLYVDLVGVALGIRITRQRR